MAMLVGAALAAAPAGGVRAQQSYDYITIEGVRAFQHVIEDNDRLFLIQYSLVAPIATPPAQQLEASGALLLLWNGVTLLEAANPPAPGYGLAGFYQAADSSRKAPWRGSGIGVTITENPTQFLDPAENPGPVVVWADSAGVEQTKAPLGLALKQMLVSLEAANPAVSPGDYVGPKGVTASGASIAERAFPFFLSVLPPEDFTISTSNPSQGEAIPTPGTHAQDVESEGRDSTFTVSTLQGLGEVGGLGDGARNFIGGLLIFGAVLGAGGFAVFGLSKRVNRSDRGDMGLVILPYIGGCLLIPSLLGMWPLSLVVGIIVLAAVLAGGIFISRFVPT